MSDDLYWRQLPSARASTQLDRQLKYKLARHLWGHDGTLRGDRAVIQVGSPAEAFVKGLTACDVPGAAQLWQAVTAHGAVEVYIGDRDGPWDS